MRGGKVPKTVDEYLAKVPEPARSTLTHIRQVIRSVVPTGTTEVISYAHTDVQVQRNAHRLRRFHEALQSVSRPVPA